MIQTYRLSIRSTDKKLDEKLKSSTVSFVSKSDAELFQEKFLEMVEIEGRKKMKCSIIAENHFSVYEAIKNVKVVLESMRS